jgi:predicted GNAT family acetyltransferase
MAAGFEMPREALAVLESPGLLGAPDLSLYLGWLDGVPVATALRASSHRIAGVFNVATVPAYRRRGLGSAMTLRAALDRREEGCLGSYLQASPSGRHLYARLGYRHVADYPSWRAPTR